MSCSLARKCNVHAGVFFVLENVLLTGRCTNIGAQEELQQNTRMVNIRLTLFLLSRHNIKLRRYAHRQR